MIKVLNNKKEQQDIIDKARREGIGAVYCDIVNPNVSTAELLFIGEQAMCRVVAYRIWEYNTRGDAPHCMQISKSRARRAAVRKFIMSVCGFSSRTTLEKIIKKGEDYGKEG
jgi:hypothetical protein